MSDKPILQVDEWGNNYWWLNGKLHRTDGPAVTIIVLAPGLDDIVGVTFEWWVDGVKLDCTTQEEFLRLIKLRAFW
jgi:hypothetical protein